MGVNADSYRHAIDCMNNGDLDGYIDFYAEDVVFGGVTPEPLDHAGVRAFHEDWVAAFPTTRVELVSLLEEGDRVAARLVLHVRHEGPFMGIEPTGADAQMAITTLLTMRDGRCVERWSTADMLGLMIQLGAVPAPAG